MVIFIVTFLKLNVSTLVRVPLTKGDAVVSGETLSGSEAQGSIDTDSFSNLSEFSITYPAEIGSTGIYETSFTATSESGNISFTIYIPATATYDAVVLFYTSMSFSFDYDNYPITTKFFKEFNIKYGL